MRARKPSLQPSPQPACSLHRSTTHLAGWRRARTGAISRLDNLWCTCNGVFFESQLKLQATSRMLLLLLDQSIMSVSQDVAEIDQ